MNTLSGELAALATAFSWSVGSIFHTVSAKRIGHKAVNQIRLVMALVLLVTSHFIIYGSFFPPQVRMHHWLWLGVSGIIGLSIGDRMLFKSYLLIGPRLSMLMMCFAPIFSTAIAWVFLNEILALKDIIAIIITLLGVGWVVFEKKVNGHDRGDHTSGILLGIGAAFCQALGLILSKKGLGNDFPALSGNIIRVLTASAALWLIPHFGLKTSVITKSIKDKKAMLALLGGAVLGPFIGVWLSLVAVKYAHVGIASTLMSLPPVLLIPLSRFFLKEVITRGAVLGTVVAFSGVALIFL